MKILLYSGSRIISLWSCKVPCGGLQGRGIVYELDVSVVSYKTPKASDAGFFHISFRIGSNATRILSWFMLFQLKMAMLYSLFAESNPLQISSILFV